MLHKLVLVMFCSSTRRNFPHRPTVRGAKRARRILNKSNFLGRHHSWDIKFPKKPNFLGSQISREVQISGKSPFPGSQFFPGNQIFSGKSNFPGSQLSGKSNFPEGQISQTVPLKWDTGHHWKPSFTIRRPDSS